MAFFSGSIICRIFQYNTRNMYAHTWLTKPVSYRFILFSRIQFHGKINHFKKEFHCVTLLIFFVSPFLGYLLLRYVLSRVIYFESTSWCHILCQIYPFFDKSMASSIMVLTWVNDSDKCSYCSHNLLRQLLHLLSYLRLFEIIWSFRFDRTYFK